MEDLQQFLNDWQNPEKRDKAQLKILYKKYLESELKKCPKCIPKAVLELHRFYETNKPKETNERKYILRPGNHVFIQGDRIHNNENSTDAELAWYVKTYPHIRSLFIKIPA